METSLKDAKIVFVINTMKEGGAAKMLAFIANLCCQYFASVTVITIFDNYEQYKLNKRIAVINLCFSAAHKGLWRIKLMHELRKCLHVLSPDIVCSFVSDVAVSTRLATLGKRYIVVSAERGDLLSLNPIWRIMARIAYTISNHCVFQTDTSMNYFNKRTRRKSTVICNPYVLKTIVSPYDGERKKTIVSAGRFAKQKGFDLLIKAFAQIHESYPEYRLIIYGDGNERDEYVKLIDEYELCPYVDLPGYVDNIPEAIREDGIFVLSSRFEGIPNILIEALSIGVPTVSTDCRPGGPAFLTDNGKRGIIVPMEDVDAMAKGILSIIKDPDYARELSIRGREVIDILNPITIEKQWANMFASLLNNRRRI